MIVGFLVNKTTSAATRACSTTACASSPKSTGGALSTSCRSLAPSASPAPRRTLSRSTRSPRTDTRAGRHDRRAACCSRIANFDDFDPLRLEPGVRLHAWSAAGEPLPARRPRHSAGHQGDRSPTSRSFAPQGWDIDLFAHVRRGGRVLGVCGGYQMLGAHSSPTPRGSKGPAGEVARARPASTSRRSWRAKRRCAPPPGFASPTALRSPVMKCTSGAREGRIARVRCCALPTDARTARFRATGASWAPMRTPCSPNLDAQRAAWLAGLGAASDLAYDLTVERTLDELAAHLARHIDLDALLALAR